MIDQFVSMVCTAFGTSEILEVACIIYVAEHMIRFFSWIYRKVRGYWHD